jgi:hypothetical protein
MVVHVIDAVGRHVRSLWPRSALLPIAPFWLWVLLWLYLGALRVEHVAIAVAATALAYGNARTRRWFIGLVPLSAVGLFYDGMRFVKNVGLSPTNVHICDLRSMELRWFGVGIGSARMTLQDWFQAHASLPVDLLAALPYGLYLYIVIGYALYLIGRDFTAQQRFAWGFFVLNVVGFATYHVFPAAPPWYFHRYGCAVDLAALPSPGPNLTRVDHALGIGYFHSFYARSSDIFGAVPSLHVAYPLLMIVEGWRLHGRVGRFLLGLFYVWMCFAATYLDHHWVIDIMVGSAYAVAVGCIMRRLIRSPFRAPRPAKVTAAGAVE